VCGGRETHLNSHILRVTADGFAASPPLLVFCGVPNKNNEVAVPLSMKDVVDLPDDIKNEIVHMKLAVSPNGYVTTAIFMAFLEIFFENQRKYVRAGGGVECVDSRTWL
jgi:hypothetical protein